MIIDTDARVAAARAKALAARGRLAGTMSDIQARLTPKVLLREAWDEVRAFGGELADEGLEAAKARPWTVTAAAGLLVLYMGRGALWRALCAAIFSEPEPPPQEPLAIEDGSAGKRTRRPPRRLQASEETEQ